MRAAVVTTVTSFILAIGVAALSGACAPPSVGSLPDDDEELPDRKTSSSSSSSGNGDNGDPSNTHASTSSSSSSSSTGGTPAPTSFAVTVTLKGTGAGGITSTPNGVTCAAGVCKGTFAKGTAVTLVAAPLSGSLFAGFTGACTGAACATTVTADTALTAEFQPVDGSWSGTYSHSEKANGCTFNNAGNLTIAVATTGGTFTNAATIGGLELRDGNCNLGTNSATGQAPASTATIDGSKVTGTLTFAVQGASGNLPLPFEATITGTKMAGKWTCTGCTGDFTLTKQ